MSATKRNRTSSASEDRVTYAKAVKIYHGHDNADVGELPGQLCSDDVQVTVKIYSHADKQKDGNTSDSADSDTSGKDDSISTLSSRGSGEQSWLKQIDCFANVGQSQVADCHAKLIRRKDMRSAFWAQMEELCEETSSLAFELFDRYGRLNREYCEHEIRKGSGIWGKELDHGDILLIENINIEPLWRRQGVGTKLVSATLDIIRHESEGFFAFANPMRLTPDLDRDDEKLDASTFREQTKTFKQFFRSLGFRRVGISGWLAFAVEESHPSRQLEKGQDWDHPEQSKKEQTVPEPIRTILSALSDPSISGAECVRQMADVFAVEANAPLRLYVDNSGNTILHVAAIGRKEEAIYYIMLTNPKLLKKRNADGHTPLEALQSSLELQRTRRLVGGARLATSVISDDFAGFRQSDIDCLATLTSTEIYNLNHASDDLMWSIWSNEIFSRVDELDGFRNALRLKYGCTCRQCIGGFLSPRMRYALLTEAEAQHEIVNDPVEPDMSGPDWLSCNDNILRYLTRAVQLNVMTNKYTRQGFFDMFEHIAGCLRQERVPDGGTVHDVYRTEALEWPPVTLNYLRRGGKVAAAALIVFDRAIKSDEWAGDGSLLEIDEDEIYQLPACRNDHEFNFVSAMCGYKRNPAVSMLGSSGGDTNSQECYARNW